MHKLKHYKLKELLIIINSIINVIKITNIKHKHKRKHYKLGQGTLYGDHNVFFITIGIVVIRKN